MHQHHLYMFYSPNFTLDCKRIHIEMVIKKKKEYILKFFCFYSPLHEREYRSYTPLTKGFIGLLSSHTTQASAIKNQLQHKLAL